MKDLPLDPNTELFRWGPAPIRAFYTGDFIEGIFNKEYFQTTFPGDLWPTGLALYRDKKMLFVNEFRDMHECGGRVFIKYMLPREAREKVFQSWLRHKEKLEAAERTLDQMNLQDLSEAEFTELWHNFHLLIATLWTDGTIPELANYGSLPILEKALRAHISNETEFHHTMEVFTAPLNPSFYKEEEMDLHETSDLASHQQKYFWIKNSYSSVEIADPDFFASRKSQLPPSPRKEFLETQRETEERKRACVAKYNLPQSVLDIADAIVAGIEWQDSRKKDIWIYLHYKDLLLKEVCRRHDFAKDDLLNFREVEVENYLKGELALEPLIVERKATFGFLCADGVVSVLSKDDALTYWDTYARDKAGEGITELKGIVASKGNGSKVTGVVSIVLDPKDAGHFKEGSILVCPMTTPEYIFVMKNCVAIITDAGGLTSHAAIVSRELKKPCIVGTKIATQVLHDGDMVEVDAHTGVVRKI